MLDLKLAIELFFLNKNIIPGACVVRISYQLLDFNPTIIHCSINSVIIHSESGMYSVLIKTVDRNHNSNSINLNHSFLFLPAPRGTNL